MNVFRWPKQDDANPSFTDLVLHFSRFDFGRSRRTIPDNRFTSWSPPWGGGSLSPIGKVLPVALSLTSRWSSTELDSVVLAPTRRLGMATP